MEALERIRSAIDHLDELQTPQALEDSVSDAEYEDVVGTELLPAIIDYVSMELEDAISDTEIHALGKFLVRQQEDSE